MNIKNLFFLSFFHISLVAYATTHAEQLRESLHHLEGQLQTLSYTLDNSAVQPQFTRAQLDSLIAEFQAYTLSPASHAHYKKMLEEIVPHLTAQERLEYEFWYYAAPLYTTMHAMDTNHFASLSVKEFTRDLSTYRAFLNASKKKASLTIPTTYDTLLKQATDYLLALHKITSKKITYETWIQQKHPPPPLPTRNEKVAEETASTPPLSPLQRALQERKEKLRTKEEQKPLTPSAPSPKESTLQETLVKAKALQQALAQQKEEKEEEEWAAEPEEESEKINIPPPKTKVAPPPPPPAPKPPLAPIGAPTHQAKEAFTQTIAEVVPTRISERRARMGYPEEEEEEQEPEEDWD